MLSICLPVYNSDVRFLVGKLKAQADRLAFPVEIIVMDDASDAEYRAQYEKLPTGVRVELLPKNAGRSVIRNRFAGIVRYDWMLFLDDGVDIPDDFLEGYAVYAKGSEPLVVCGGKRNGSRPAYAQLLRWRYARKRENLPAEIRTQRPYHSFVTGNFLIHRSVFDFVRFEESLTGYGHEDTLFGFELRLAKVSVQHIDNKVIINSFDSVKNYLKKTREGVENLLRVLQLTDYNSDLVDNIRLLQVYQHLPCSVSGGCFRGLARPLFHLSGFLMLIGIPSLRLLDLYKLCHLILVQPAFFSPAKEKSEKKIN